MFSIKIDLSHSIMFFCRIVLRLFFYAFLRLTVFVNIRFHSISKTTINALVSTDLRLNEQDVTKNADAWKSLYIYSVIFIIPYLYSLLLLVLVKDN